MSIYIDNRISNAWFPRYTKKLSTAIFGKCYLCGSDPKVYDHDYIDKLTSQPCYTVGVECSHCPFALDSSTGVLPGYPATEESRERARTKVATLWNGKEAKPPLLSFGEWAWGTVFTGGNSPEWAIDDDRQYLPEENAYGQL